MTNENPEIYEPETDPTVKWWQRGGFTTIAMIGLVLGIACWLVIGAGALFFDFALVRGFVPFPAIVGLLFGLLGFALGPWKIVGGAAVLLNIGAMVLVFLV